MMVMRICSMATDPGRHGAMTPNAVGIGVADGGTNDPGPTTGMLPTQEENLSETCGQAGGARQLAPAAGGRIANAPVGGENTGEHIDSVMHSCTGAASFR